MPNTQHLAVVLTIMNSVLLIIGLDRHGSAFSQGDAPVLRGRGLDLVDASGRLKAEGGRLKAEAVSFLYRREQGMDLGAFSVSLSVKDLEASRSFYEKFGFKVRRR